MEKKPFDHAFTFKDDVNCRETFADGIPLVTVDGTTLRIVFTVSRPDPPKGGSKAPTGHKVVAARMVVPLPALADLYNQLDRMVRGLESQGLMQRGDSGFSPTVQ